MIQLENVLKVSLQDVFKTSSKRLEDVLRCLEDIFASRLENVLKMSWRCFGKDVLNTYDEGDYVRLDQDVLKTSWRRLLKTKTKDVFKTSSRRLHQDECLVGLLYTMSSVPSSWISIKLYWTVVLKSSCR